MKTTASVELLALQRIDETSVQLQKQGNYVEALECMERALVLRQHFFGSDSEEVWRACKTVGEMCNLLAMTYLQQEDYKMVIELLRKANILTERDLVGKAVTYNNFACYYRRRGRLTEALKYLEKAVKIETKLAGKADNPADTHLNLCAVLSQCGRHQAALQHAQSALILMQEEIYSNTKEEFSQGKTEPRPDRIAVLAIAYHNQGVELEFLRNFREALIAYEKGVQIARKHLGNDHGISVTLQNSALAARKTVRRRKYGVRRRAFPKPLHRLSTDTLSRGETFQDDSNVASISQIRENISLPAVSNVTNPSIVRPRSPDNNDLKSIYLDVNQVRDILEESGSNDVSNPDEVLVNEDVEQKDERERENDGRGSDEREEGVPQEEVSLETASNEGDLVHQIASKTYSEIISGSAILHAAEDSGKASATDLSTQSETDEHIYDGHGVKDDILLINKSFSVESSKSHQEQLIQQTSKTDLGNTEVEDMTSINQYSELQTFAKETTSSILEQVLSREYGQNPLD